MLGRISPAMKRSLLPALFLVGTAMVDAQVYASNLSSSEVFAYDEITGQRRGGAAFITAGAGGLNQPHGILPRGTDILVSSYGTDSVKLYNRLTGAYAGDFATSAQGIDNPVLLKVGPDQRLYLSSQGNHRILRFDLATGAAADAQPFIQGGQLSAPSGFDWSPDKSVLYVAGRASANVLAYNAQTGAALATVHVFASGLGAGNTFGLAVTPQGDVFVATNNQVRRYSPAGALLATLGIAAIGLEQAPDGTGILAASGGTIRRINLSDNSVSNGSLLTPAPGSVNFFRWPAQVVPRGPFLMETGGQRYAAIEFGVTKWALAQSRMQFSTDLFHWDDAVTYTPTGTGVQRNGAGLTVQHSLVDYGDRVVVIERDAEPAGTRQRRFYQMAPP